MGEFSEQLKTNVDYLDVAANGNGAEKALFTIEALKRLKGTATHIVELGPGGGSAIGALVDSVASYVDTDQNKSDISLSLVELDSVHSDSLDRERERFESRIGPTALYNQSAQEINDIFGSETIDVISGSAIMHEIYSYGKGYGDLRQVMGSISEVLKPGGYFAYRDVYPVSANNLHERTIQAYSAPGWLEFIKNFVPHYLASANHPYHRNDDELQVRQDSKKVSVEDIDSANDIIASGPIGLFREVQRHYITFRDHVWRSGTLGFKPELDGKGSSDWLDIKKGHKRVHFELVGSELLSSGQEQLLKAMSEKQDDKYVIDGDIFDEVTNTAIYNFFKELYADNIEIENVWRNWLSREGSETYAYLTLDQLLGTFALESYDAQNESKSIMLPVNDFDVQKTPRAYYNRFLNSQLPNPLYDGKQLVLFRKTLVSDVEYIEAGLQVAQNNCSRETLANLYRCVNRDF